MLTVKNLSASIESKEILHDISFRFEPGKTYALMGPNGSGKSTLAHALLGRPDVSYTRKSAMLMGKKSIKHLSPDKRANAGLFMSFQNPLSLPGVTVFELLRMALEKHLDPVTLHDQVKNHAKTLSIKEELLRRSLNDGFSGGEKKKMEALQAALLSPRVAIFDELDTGVDVDALKIIVTFLKKNLPRDTTRIFITHSTRLLKVLKPDQVIVLYEGRIIKIGGESLAKEIEQVGFKNLQITEEKLRMKS